MSAIWGYIGKNDIIPENLNKRILPSISEYVIDKIEEKSIGGVYFGCGHQYITKEDESDVAPIYDKERSIVFNGDCFLYNRADVIEQVGNTQEYQNFRNKHSREPGDIELAYLCYVVYGKQFVSVLRGSFAFAIYHVDTEILDLITDHLVKRYIAYYLGEDGIYFGSTYQLIKALANRKFEINREFIINSYRDLSPLNFFVPEITPFKGIYHLENATFLSINRRTQEVDKEQYWNPLKNVKKLHLKSDEAYKELFLKTYEKVAYGMLRSDRETGIMLSGGLDSSSVAALVAPKLAAQGKKLYSYTSTPSSQYKERDDDWIIDNETFLVEEQKKRHNNLEPRYVKHDHTNIMAKMQHFQSVFSIPVKPSVNMLNIDTMSKKAREDGCRILLGGGNGNPTVSFGEPGNYFSLTLLSGHPIKTLQEISAYCKLHGKSRKRYLKSWAKIIIKSALIAPKEYTYYLKKADRAAYGLEHASLNHKRQFGTELLVTERQKNNFMYMPIQYIQKGFYYTCQGLRYGYEMLDPTLSVEMIELALSLPYDCFFRHGIDRRMVRVYMQELIPEAILDIKKGYGVQAADFIFNINRDWEQIKGVVYDILEEPLLEQYLDKEELENLKKSLRDNEHNLNVNDACAATQIGSLGFFLRENN